MHPKESTRLLYDHTVSFHMHKYVANGQRKKPKLGEMECLQHPFDTLVSTLWLDHFKKKKNQCIILKKLSIYNVFTFFKMSVKKSGQITLR